MALSLLLLRGNLIGPTGNDGMGYERVHGCYGCCAYGQKIIAGNVILGYAAYVM